MVHISSVIAAGVGSSRRTSSRSASGTTGGLPGNPGCRAGMGGSWLRASTCRAERWASLMRIALAIASTRVTLGLSISPRSNEA